jgi:hypothetical protein
MSRVTDTIQLTEDQFEAANNLMLLTGLCALCRSELGKERALLAQPYSSFHKTHKGKLFLGAVCMTCQKAIQETFLKLKSGEKVMA